MNKYAFDDDDDEDEMFNYDPIAGGANKNAPPKGTYDHFGFSSKSNKNEEAPTQAVNVRRFKDETQLVYKDETLDDKFELAAWLPPDVERAKEYNQTKTYKGARYEAVRIVTTSDLSIGINYHFMFLKTMSYGLVFMTLLAIPTMFFSFFGQGTPVQQRDILMTYQLSIGELYVCILCGVWSRCLCMLYLSRQYRHSQLARRLCMPVCSVLYCQQYMYHRAGQHRTALVANQPGRHHI